MMSKGVIFDHIDEPLSARETSFAAVPFLKMSLNRALRAPVFIGRGPDSACRTACAAAWASQKC